MPSIRKHSRISPTARKQSKPDTTKRGLSVLVGPRSDNQKKWLDANRPGPDATELHRLVYAEFAGCWHCHNPLQLRLLRQPREGSTWKDYADEVLAGLGQRDLSLLGQLGNAGDPQAIESFAELTGQMVQTLNAWAGGKHKPILQRIAAKRVAWPMQIAKRKAFGDDVERLKAELPIGRDTIAADPNARFNPASKFGKVALELLARIEEQRARVLWFQPPPSWAHEARKLPPFTRKASAAEKEKWRAIVTKFLDEDFRNPERAKSYRGLVSAPSHQRRWKSVFRNKVLSEFDSLWGIHRQPS